MHGKQHTVNRPLCIAAVLICLTVLTTYLLSGIYAKFFSSAQATDKAVVAKFVFTAPNQTQVMKSEITSMSPSGTVTYTFTVSNHSDTSVCEVSQAYTVCVSDFGNLPLSYTLTKNDEAAVPLAKDTPTAKQPLPAGAAQEDTWVLSVTWDGTENAYTYADEIDLITVSVASEQVD